MSDGPLGTTSHTIRKSDTLWSIAKMYGTTVEVIVSANPGINPQNLPVGRVIVIRPGCVTTSEEVRLRNTIRLLWEQHVEWTRMTIISIAADLADEALVTGRLLRNPSDSEMVLRLLYGNEKAARFRSLLREHLVIASELVKAAKAGDSKAAADAERRWYANADEIAAFMNEINPFWSREAFTKMLHTHLALTKSEAVARLSKDYARDIAIYDEIEMQALEMADAMVEGILKQFPDRFR